MLSREEIRKNIKKIINLNYNSNFKTQQEADTESLRNLNILANTFPDAIAIAFDDTNQYQPNIIVNCYAYTFGFESSELFRDKYFQIKNITKKEGIPVHFVYFLIEIGYLQETKTPIKNCLVLYFDDKKKLQHAAILEKEAPDEDARLARSRWGDFKAILTHKLWHIPDYYGTKIKYYHPLSTKESETYFYEFLKTQGVAFAS